MRRAGALERGLVWPQAGQRRARRPGTRRPQAARGRLPRDHLPPTEAGRLGSPPLNKTKSEAPPTTQSFKGTLSENLPQDKAKDGRQRQHEITHRDSPLNFGAVRMEGTTYADMSPGDCPPEPSPSSSLRPGFTRPPTLPPWSRGPAVGPPTPRQGLVQSARPCLHFFPAFLPKIFFP